MSGVAFVLTWDLIAAFPELAPTLAATVLSMIAILELASPVIVRKLLDWTGESAPREGPVARREDES